MQPRLLLLDEPFGGLDLVTKQQIVGEIARLRAELGFAMILVTHDYRFIEQDKRGELGYNTVVGDRTEFSSLSSAAMRFED